jgi:hypothetical protein
VPGPPVLRHRVATGPPVVLHPSQSREGVGVPDYLPSSTKPPLPWRVRSWLRVKLLRLLLRFSWHRVVSGVHIFVLENGRWEPGRCGARVTEAINLLMLHDNRAYQRIREFGMRIFCFPLRRGVAGEYIYDINTCLLDPRYVLDEQTPPFLIANTLVHETTHAQLDRLGITVHPTNHERIESICIRAEMAFLKRVAGADARRILNERASRREALRSGTVG